jgi:hypothetical protein
MSSLVMGMHRITTVHDTVSVSGALEAFVRLFSATANASVGVGAHSRKEELLFGSGRAENVISVDPCINATDAVETRLKFIVYRPRHADSDTRVKPRMRKTPSVYSHSDRG